MYRVSYLKLYTVLSAMETNKRKRIAVPPELLLEKVMGIQLISEQIMHLLSTRDLLACSIVNRIWNYSARTILRKHRICLAVLTEDNALASIRDLTTTLENAVSPPFNGLFISTNRKIFKIVNIDSEDNRTVLISNFLKIVSFEHLKIYWDFDHRGVTVSLIKRMLGDFGPIIKYLHIELLPYDLPRLIDTFGVTPDNQQKWLPNLKTLKLKSPNINTIRAHYVKDLIASSPNLQNVYGVSCTRMAEGLMIGNTFSKIEHFHFHSEDYQRSRTLHTLLTLEFQPNLTQLYFTQFAFRNQSGFSWWKKTLKKLWNCYGMSLKELGIYHLDLLLLSNIDLPALPKLDKLNITYNADRVSKDGQPHLRGINFSKLFSQLLSVVIQPDNGCPPGRILGSNSNVVSDYMLFDTSNGYTCKTVNKLEIVNQLIDGNLLTKESGNLRCLILPLLAKRFPAVKELTYYGCNNISDIFTVLWSSWKTLECLSLALISYDNFVDSESGILGISKVEWLHWKENLTEELDFKLFQFVPIRPSILNCNKLKKLRMEFQHSCNNSTQTQTTELGGLLEMCAFSRMTNLHVELSWIKCRRNKRGNGEYDACVSTPPMSSFIVIEPEQSTIPNLHSLC